MKKEEQKPSVNAGALGVCPPMQEEVEVLDNMIRLPAYGYAGSSMS